MFTEAKTFDREAAAGAWNAKRERELSQPGALESAKAQNPTLAEVIDRYIRESKRDLGRTKAQVLNMIKAASIGSKRCSELKSPDYREFANSLKVKPQTVGNYMSHLSAVIHIARPAWGYSLVESEFDDAVKVARKMGLTLKSGKRYRRPTPDELDRILSYYMEM
ncbi:hypothetical protein [Burkholderia sp. A1]|uniref:hypothetical protein n=1 Tax=Burkholderia sp. A1 TaxID=148446 RepID=UPI0007C44309|nr:hypothetical protein [Burkholderia sp. A1]